MSDTDSFANKYRPRRLSQLVGQEKAVAEIEGMFERNKPAKALLLSGQRGNGKTTLARIYARMINGLASDAKMTIDIQDINAANERGIDNIRSLVETLKFAPTTSKFRVIIMDEAHQLTKEAFTALLKPLEEPPAHVVWIFCTNEPHKLPATIRDRFYHIELRDVMPEQVITFLTRVCKAEKIFLPIKEKANRRLLKKIAESTGGNPRQAVTVLEKAANFASAKKEIDLKEITQFIAADVDKASAIIVACVFKAKDAPTKEIFDVAIKQICSTKDYGSLIRSMIELNTYLMEKRAGVWTYPSYARKLLDNLFTEKKIQYDVKRAVLFHNALTSLLSKSMYTGVNEKALVMATIGGMMIGEKNVE